MAGRQIPGPGRQGTGPAGRGRLLVYLGCAPGAGTTCAMLNEAHRLTRNGTDVVVAYTAVHGRPCTAALLTGLEVTARAKVLAGGAVVEELDLEAVLARAPAVALVDELAHRNAPGSRHATRWMDAEELLQAGIDVVATVEVRQLDSLCCVAANITGSPHGQTVPDVLVRAADEIQIVDTAPETLRDRMARGDIYPVERAEAALACLFRIEHLSALRELALLWLAATLTRDRHRYGGAVPGTRQARERVVAALTGGPDDDMLIRRAARLAARSGADLMAVRVAPDGPPGAGRASLTAQRQLVRSVGGTYHQLSDHDIPSALLTFARAENATQMVLGASRRSWRPVSRTSIPARVLRGATGIDLHFVTCPQTTTDSPLTPPVAISSQARSGQAIAGSRPPEDPSGSRRKVAWGLHSRAAGYQREAS